MEKENLIKNPPSPLAMRALGQAFQSAGGRFRHESFVEAGEKLLDAADDMDPPPKQDVEKNSNWIAVSIRWPQLGAAWACCWVGLQMIIGPLYGG